MKHVIKYQGSCLSSCHQNHVNYHPKYHNKTGEPGPVRFMTGRPVTSRSGRFWLQGVPGAGHGAYRGRLACDLHVEFYPKMPTLRP